MRGVLTFLINNYMSKRYYPTEQCFKKTDHELWQRWTSLRNRCENPNNYGYPYYGGRGIKVDPRWNDFWTFVNDVETEIGPLPFPGAFLDRIDNDGNYEPGNIQWSNARVNSNNRTSNYVVTAFGISQTLAEFARLYNIPARTIWSRIKDYGMTPEQAILKGRKK